MPKGTGDQEHLITRDPARLPRLAPFVGVQNMTTRRSHKHKESDIFFEVHSGDETLLEYNCV